MNFFTIHAQGTIATSNLSNLYDRYSIKGRLPKCNYHSCKPVSSLKIKTKLRPSSTAHWTAIPLTMSKITYFLIWNKILTNERFCLKWVKPYKIAGIPLFCAQTAWIQLAHQPLTKIHRKAWRCGAGGRLPFWTGLGVQDVNPPASQFSPGQPLNSSDQWKVEAKFFKYFG